MFRALGVDSDNCTRKRDAGDEGHAKQERKGDRAADTRWGCERASSTEEGQKVASIWIDTRRLGIEIDTRAV